MIVDITAEAESDLEPIGDHIAEDNPVRAVSFLQELRDKCLTLADLALAFPLVPLRTLWHPAPSVRQLPHLLSS
ncbi:type II toxin-antitoxin system RelE/ParE family toxin [Sedimenticola hydrogenitrophicus]|uniref:type II toxin-antitoxin system RelE/ParE family toxin n=1 Tax=Sedimenticola hydrogenitrophicus TaxID=2967975 RepID=UPI002FF93841